MSRFRMMPPSLLELVLDQIPAAVVAVDRDATVTGYNAAASRLFGVRPDDILGRPVSRLPLLAPLLQEVLNSCISAGPEPFSVNGTPHLLFRTALVRGTEVVGAVAVTVPSPGAAVAGPAMSPAAPTGPTSSLDLDLWTLVESVYDEVIVADKDGTILSFTTRQLDPSWGVSKPEELIGLNILEVERRGWFKPSVTRLVLEQGRRVSVVQESRLGKQILAVGNPVFDENGDLQRVVVASRDITELRVLRPERDLGWQPTSTPAEHPVHSDDPEFPDEIVYRSPQMRRVLDEVSKVASAGSTVILYGESGVGKELIARAIHRMGKRKDGPFVKINCGAIPDNLLESELFGYERGAFTGANRHGKPGLIEMAHKGVLFLDEISEMPLNLQVKLLRVLQERELIRIGGTQLIHVDVQIVVASNKDLEELVEKGLFREDLFYRLYVVPITIPPLRERPADIVPLALHFLEIFNKKYGTDRRLSAETFHLLEAYPWPGNVRELQNVIERLVVTADQDEIGIEHLAPCLKLKRIDKIKPTVPTLMPLREALEAVALELVRMAMERFKTTRKAASALGVSQATVSRLYQRLKQKSG